MATSRYILKLYVTGRTGRARRAIDALDRICREELDGTYTVEVIDVLEEPEKAEEQDIQATPTVVRELPPPVRRIIGDLSDTAKVLVGLDLVPVAGRRDGGLRTRS